MINFPSKVICCLLIVGIVHCRSHVSLDSEHLHEDLNEAFVDVEDVDMEEADLIDKINELDHTPIIWLGELLMDLVELFMIPMRTPSLRIMVLTEDIHQLLQKVIDTRHN